MSMDFRTAGHGAALAAVAVLALSSSAAVISLKNVGLFPADYGNPDYLALVIWLIFAAVSAAVAAFVLRGVFRTMNAIRRNSEIDCYRMVSSGSYKTKVPKGKMPKV